MFYDSFIPRPEYPRPDRQRGRIEGVDWLNLNGPWQFRFDLHREGVERNWADPSCPDWSGQIIVPFCWESLAAWGEGDAASNDNYYSTRAYLNPYEVTKENHRSAKRYEVGWYRRKVEVPTKGPWRGKRAILTVGAADFFTDCWCNGVHLGTHEGGYVPFEFDLTDTLSEPDEHGIRHGMLVLRVEDPMDHCEQPVGKQWGWYTTTSGIWQTVFVEPRSTSHIDHFRIFPDIDREHVSFELHAVGELDQAHVAVDIIPPGAPGFQFRLDWEGGVFKGDTEIHPVILWDTGDPKIYRVVFRLIDDHGMVLDEVRGYFGMRKISTAPVDDAPAMLCLNNKPIYLRGALYQSYYPDGVYTARDTATLINDIRFAIAMGFDFLRIHIKLDDPLFLYYADTLGILLMQDFPNFGEGGDTPTGRRRFEEMMREGFKRDFNHPSIISWCIFNETWGFGGQHELMKIITPDLPAHIVREEGEKIANSSAFKWVHEMWNLAKSLDPTRLIEDMSVVVWEHLASYGHVDTDVNSWHFYIDDYEKAKAHIEEVVSKTYHGSTFNYIEGFTQRNVPLINSEYGGVGALDGDRDVSWTFKFLTNELRRHGELSAYIYTELMDVEWENNGLMNYDRTPKDFGYPPHLINQGDVLPISAPPIERLEPGGTVEIEVLSSHFSRRRRDGITFHWMYSGMDSTGKWRPVIERGHCRIPFRHHRVERARLLHLQLPAEPMLCTLSVAAVSPEGQTIASNFIQHFVCGTPPPEREAGESRLILRRRIEDWDLAEWTGPVSTREEAVRTGSCYGTGSGFFEWSFADESLSRLSQAARIYVLLEVSSRRDDTPQTDTYRYPSYLVLSVNGLPILRTLIPDHPHDTKGALSYLRGQRGAYGYLFHQFIENELLQAIAQRAEADGALRLRASVTEAPIGGLTVYDYDCGRYPVAPTVIIDWSDASCDGTVNGSSGQGEPSE
jgi:hypothetical protein